MEQIIPIEMGMAILGILVTTFVAIYSIRKTAEANRVSTVHNEMVQCVIDSIVKMRMIRNLLNEVANRVSYYRLPENELIETAFVRYWREIQPITTEFKIIQAKQMFVFPKSLYEKMQNLIHKINEARDKAEHYNPASDTFTSGDNDLSEYIKEINNIYVDFVNDARRYVGASALVPISVNKEQILQVEENKES